MAVSREFFAASPAVILLSLRGFGPVHLSLLGIELDVPKIDWGIDKVVRL
jgi:hypothetical protein